MKYYYNKYVADEASTFSNPDASFAEQSTGNSGFHNGYTGYTWSTSSGFTTTGSYITSGAPVLTFTVGGGNAVFEYVNQIDDTFDFWSKYCTETTEYSQGALVQQNIIAEDGTYPDDGRQDGYWWVKGALVPTTSGFLALFF